MTNPIRRTAAVLALAIFACVSAAAQVPARMVSTSPSITETLFALGVGDRVVGVSTYCRFPAEVAKLPKVGTFLKPDPEIINIGEMGEAPSDSERRQRITEDLWKRQTLVKAVRENGVRAVHDEAFVVPGPRVVVVAETLAEWFHGVRVR